MSSAGLGVGKKQPLSAVAAVSLDANGGVLARSAIVLDEAAGHLDIIASIGDQTWAADVMQPRLASRQY